MRVALGWVAGMIWLLAVPVWAQTAAATASLKVTVNDATGLGLPHAVVTITDAAGASREAHVDEQGVATFSGLAPGTYEVRSAADGFRALVQSVTVRRGANTTQATLPVALSEEITVAERSAEERRDNGFTQTLTADEIDALSDDPDEMAEQLAQMAGPGAQIFVNGFRGGRLPPKDQIQQIRFNSNSYSAEYHDAGMVRVEIITRPGMGDWSGRANFGFRDESLNARNAFAPIKEPTQQERLSLSMQGPLVKERTGLSLDVDGTWSYDSRTIRAQASPTAAPVAGLARNTNDALGVNVRVDQSVGTNGQLQVEYDHRWNGRDNLGVGDFDLPERGIDVRVATDLFRVRSTGLIGRKAFRETRIEFTRDEESTVPYSELPTLRVNDAFTSGGAGQSGTRTSHELQLTQTIDFTIGRRHSLRAGVLLEAGRWRSTQQDNANGTYVFTSLANYQLGRPATYSLRTGDPLVEYSQVKAGWFMQDDFRLAKTLSVSVGLRQEIQTQMRDYWNLAPRVAFTWNATRKTTVRGGYGIFYDWYEANLHEQTLRVDGQRQVDIVVVDPLFPSTADGGQVLPPSIIRASALQQPMIQQASIGVERPLAATVSMRADYMLTRGTGALRSVNVNAPIDGVRPIPTAGNITEIQSTGRRASDRLTVSLNARNDRLRLFSNVMYQLQSVRNHADSATALPADSNNPDIDWGPSRQDIRHRLFVNLNAPVFSGIRFGFNMQMASAPPYNITTGRDDNGDTVFNDRAPGVGRNSGRGAGTINASLRINKSFGFGGAVAGGPAGRGGRGGPRRSQASGTGAAMLPPPAAPPAYAQRGMGGGGGDGPRIMIMEGGTQRYQLDIYAQISNVLNYVNYNTFIGNQLSPFFGQATSAGAPRRIEVGFSLSL
jgi:hypothetical protein